MEVNLCMLVVVLVHTMFVGVDSQGVSYKGCSGTTYSVRCNRPGFTIDSLTLSLYFMEEADASTCVETDGSCFLKYLSSAADVQDSTTQLYDTIRANCISKSACSGPLPAWHDLQVPDPDAATCLSGAAHYLSQVSILVSCKEPAITGVASSTTSSTPSIGESKLTVAATTVTAITNVTSSEVTKSSVLTSTTSTDTSKGEGKGSHTTPSVSSSEIGIGVGVAAGVIVIILIVAIAVFLIRRDKRKGSFHPQDTPTAETGNQPAEDREQR